MRKQSDQRAAGGNLRINKHKKGKYQPAIKKHKEGGINQYKPIN